MLIDWFTVCAQAFNFLILVWLMKRFLYKPILNTIDAREKRIAAELADADAKKAEAQKERDEFQHKNAEIDQQREALLGKATDEAQAERQRLLEEARQAANSLETKRMETLRNDARNLSQAISLRTQQEVFAIARKALTDLAATSLDERMAEVFIRRLREMDGQEKDTMAGALKAASEPALVRSACELPEEQRAAIQNALNETFSAEIDVQFVTSPDLIGGIELTTNGQKVAWSIADYLASLEKGVEELLKEKDKAEAKTSSDLTPQIAKRAYELYEQGGSKSDSAIQDWSQAEQEIRKEGDKPRPRPETKPEPEPETKPKAEAEPKPEPESKPKPKSRAKPEAKPKLTPKAQPEPKPEKPKPDVKGQ